jgi:hypothetical protein
MDNSINDPSYDEDNSADRPEEMAELEDALSRANMAMGILLILFLLSLGLLIYYQFYQGNGRWAFDLRHKDSGAATVNAPADSGRLTRLTHEVDSLRLSLPNSAAASNTVQPQPATTSASNSGTYFTLQIAAFKGENISGFQNGLSPAELQTDGDVSRLTIGQFNSYDNALAFRNSLAKKGISGWVVKMVNGQRVQL